MIRHIVFFGLKDKQSLEQVKQALEKLAEIGEHLVFEVSVNIKKDLFDNSIELVVYAEFADEAHLQRYKDHPIYEQSVRFVRPLRSERYSADVHSHS